MMGVLTYGSARKRTIGQDMTWLKIASMRHSSSHLGIAWVYNADR
jgi:hypothetical protein